MLTKAQILAADDMKRVSVQVPEWGGDVLVRPLTGCERDAIETRIVEDRKAGKPVAFRATLVAMSTCDEGGNLLFEESDIEALGVKSSAPLDRIYDVASRLSGFTKSDVKELEKN